MLLGIWLASSPVMALDVMPIGDSITRGYYACSYRTQLVQSLANLNSCSINMVGSMFSPEYPPSGTCTTANINHEGHGGWATTNFLTIDEGSTIPRIRIYLNDNTPDIVLLHIGTNDMGNGTGKFEVGTYNSSTNQGTNTIGRIVTMIEEVYAANSNAHVFVADLIPVTTNSTHNTNISQLRTVIGSMVTDRANDGDDITLVPVSSGYTSDMMQSDGIHPNAEGEEHIAGKFLTAMQSQGICPPTSVPSAITKIAPNDFTPDSTPTYQWQAQSNASSYYLWVNDATGNAVQQVLTPSAANCGSGTGNCSFTPPSAIYGNNQWWVRGSNSVGHGSWGSAMNFSTPAGTTPGKVALVSPVSGTAGTSPQFRWNAQSSASKYYLWVNDGSGTRVQQYYTSAQAQCSSGTGVCQATPDVILNSGSIDWWVQASNGSGTGAWSSAGSFFIGGLPGTASLLQPGGSGSGSNPAYSWNAVSNATYYMLWVNEGSTNRIAQWYTAAQVNCPNGTGTCSITSPISTTGSRSWWIRTWNPAGYGSWSSQKNFN